MKAKQRTVSIRYYAILREQRGAAEEELTTAAATASQLYDELKARYGFSLPAARLQVAINDEFQGWDSALAEHDVVVFIPPVAGG